MIRAAVVIAYRDRGDQLRAANALRVLEHWEDFGAPVHVVDDGRSGDAPFSRSRAYNRGARFLNADVIVFAEADMLVPHQQINDAVARAYSRPGLVVPFDCYRRLTPAESTRVRAHSETPEQCVGGRRWPRPFITRRRHRTLHNTVRWMKALPPQVHTPMLHTVVGGTMVGPVNVISTVTLAAVMGFDENFHGHAYDDLAMFQAFELAAGRTRWVEGQAFHLYHPPGANFAGINMRHVTAEDKAATAANRKRYRAYCRARTVADIRVLTSQRTPRRANCAE